MTKEELRTEVCKCLGWSEVYTELGLKHVPPGSDPITINHKSLPPLDLNLMWQAEETITNSELPNYGMFLLQILNEGSRVCDFRSYPGDFVWHANAEQRARAFLKAKATTVKVKV